MMDQCYQVKQFLGVITNPKNGIKFNIYAVGDPKYVLFRVLTPYGCEGGIEFPVKRSDLKYPLPRP